MKAILVYNGNAGGAQSKAALTKMCRNAGITIEEAFSVSDSLESQLKPLTKKSVTIIAVGGDGTQSAIANIVAGTKAMLAPIPGGTLNHFTKDLGVPQDIEAAIKGLSRAKVRSIDVASVNDHIFINNSSIGLYPTSLKVRDRIEDKLGKWPAAVVAAFRTFLRLRVFTVTIGSETFKTPFVFIGNNEYKVDGLGVPERTTMASGKLSVYMAKTVSRWVLLKIALFALVGKSKLLNEFEVRSPASLTIKMKRKEVHVSYDGEVRRMTPPLVYGMRPKNLRILA